MNRARFVAAARREFLAEVAYYNNEQPGLGARFVAAIEEATAGALTFPSAGSTLDRYAAQGTAASYVCRGTACSAPITALESLLKAFPWNIANLSGQGNRGAVVPSTGFRAAKDERSSGARHPDRCDPILGTSPHRV